MAYLELKSWVKQHSVDAMSGSARTVTTARYSKSQSQPAFQMNPALGETAVLGNIKPSVKPSQYKLLYIGNTTLDRRVTDKMLRWVLVDIKRKKNVNKKGVLIITDAHARFISQTDSSDVIMEHNVHTISKFSRCQRDRKCLFYLQRNGFDAPFVMFAFACTDEDKVVDIFNRIQGAAKTTSRPQFNRKLQSTKMFEVRYQGHIPLTEKSKSGEFLDRWLLKRHAHLIGHESLKKGSHLQVKNPRLRHSSDGGKDSVVTSDTTDGAQQAADEKRGRRLSEGDERDRHDSGSSHSAASSIRSEDNLTTIDSGVSDSEDYATRHSSFASANSVTSDVFDEVDERGDTRRSTLISTQDTNKTMLFQIDDDRTSIISLDKKSIILEKTHKEISYCTQGKQFSDHFGFISSDSKARKEGKTDHYVMYIFQCASDSVITEVMDTLRSAFSAVHKRNLELQSCEHCPMQQYHKLCEDLTSIKDFESAYNCVQTHILNLPLIDYTDLMNKVKSEQCRSYEEANDVLMTKLRIMCELRQMDHVHGKETEFNILHSKQSKLNAFKNRAKKALAFDMFGKGRSQELEWKPPEYTAIPDLNLSGIATSDIPSPSPSPVAKVSFNVGETLSSPIGRPRSRTVGDIDSKLCTDLITSTDPDKHFILQKLSSMGHSLEEAIRGERNSSPDKSSALATRKASMPAFNAVEADDELAEIAGPISERKKHRRVSSWRRDIFESVVSTPNSNSKRSALAHVSVKRTAGKEELRGMWRSAIEQTIILNRMEKENKNLREHEEMMKHKRSQLDYQDVTPCREDVVNRWRSLLSKLKTSDSSSKQMPKVDLWNLVKDGPASLRDMVKHGVPRQRRGEIWKLLAKQYNISIKGLHDHAEERPSNMPQYLDLLQGLTPHQHAILIDLGRTFPQHDYFKMQLGAGQLALFNILKAYSLVDTEVGYCQGLGFVAGILLMHIKEEESFELLCHLMYELGLRKLYKPNMAGLQVSMYQLARLMRDKHPTLYAHLEDVDVTPMLYAAPWFITLFSSQFTIGFVSRVFDFLFMEGYSAVFKIALSLVSVHHDAIMASDSFEGVMNVFKTSLPAMTSCEMEQVFQEANSLDLANQLYTYQVEYHVMEEDAMASIEGGEDIQSKLEAVNNKLREKNSQLADKLNAHTYKLHNQETMIEALQQSHAKLTKQMRQLELERVKHLTLIGQLREFVPQHLLKQLDSITEPLSNGSSPGL
ncbi:TBC1 domain family member 4-like [Watersipora subatra]|uniref:TBC1 domain family member 4-like n=1 Tax=Watersipora subatra TaxID=2589382 RepID=UPI00355C8EC4